MRNLKKKTALKYLLIFLVVTWLGPVQAEAREPIKEMFLRRKELDIASSGLLRKGPSEVRYIYSLHTQGVL